MKNNMNEDRDNTDLSSLRRRVTRTSRDPISTHTQRRLFGMDFMLVILFLVIAFYFFWPKMFQTPEPYAPETAIQECMHLFLTARNTCRELCATNQEIHVEDLALALEKIQPPGERESKILLWKPPDQVILGSTFWIEEWDRASPPWKFRQPGAMIFRQKGIAVLIFFEPLPPTDATLVVMKRFNPMFQRKTKP